MCCGRRWRPARGAPPTDSCCQWGGSASEDCLLALTAHCTAQVNAAVDEAAALGEATAKLMATVRRDSRTVLMAERKRAQTLLHSVVVGYQPC